MASADRTIVSVEGRELTLSNLDKVLYPDAGFTKGDVLRYYVSIAPVLLTHLRGRPLTVRRYPNGVDQKSFFEKNNARSAPEWIDSVEVPSLGSKGAGGSVHHVLVSDLASLTWIVNLASLELHTPMWRFEDGRRSYPDMMVFDLDPGPPASIIECCQVAQILKDRLDVEGLIGYPKTSGSKGLQVYVPLDGGEAWEGVHARARDWARSLERAHPGLIVSNMRKDLRKGKVLIDWSQNNVSKTTISPYSLRARSRPTVSTPLTWPEVAEVVDGAEVANGAGGADGVEPKSLSFVAQQVQDRVAVLGDLFEGCGA
ncbi:MAG: non-homologous end-joining DNA ligase [Acidimicrobiales bacterium]